MELRPQDSAAQCHVKVSRTLVRVPPVGVASSVIMLSSGTSAYRNEARSRVLGRYHLGSNAERADNCARVRSVMLTQAETPSLGAAGTHVICCLPAALRRYHMRGESEGFARPSGETESAPSTGGESQRRNELSTIEAP